METVGAFKYFIAYHETPDGLAPQNPYAADLAPRNVPFVNNNLFKGSLSITFKTFTLMPTLLDFRVSNFLEENDDTKMPGHIRGELLDKLEEKHDETLCNVGGHPRWFSGYANKTICLFSIGSIGCVLDWVDGGEGCFLISPDDLKSRRFKDCVYYWDFS